MKILTYTEFLRTPNGTVFKVVSPNDTPLMDKVWIKLNSIGTDPNLQFAATELVPDANMYEMWEEREKAIKSSMKEPRNEDNITDLSIERTLVCITTHDNPNLMLKAFAVYERTDLNMNCFNKQFVGIIDDNIENATFQ